MPGSSKDDEHEQQQQLDNPPPDSTPISASVAAPEAPTPAAAAAPSFPSTSLQRIHHPRQLLVSCAELISMSDFSSASQLLSTLLSDHCYSSPSAGDSTTRLVYQFARALRLRLLLQVDTTCSTFNSCIVTTGLSDVDHGRGLISSMAPLMINPLENISSTPSGFAEYYALLSSAAADQYHTSPGMTTTSTTVPARNTNYSTLEAVDQELQLLQEGDYDDDHREEEATAEAQLGWSSYLCLNKVTPFIRFCHLTANQAILEAVDGHQAIHVLDLDIMHGVQWPPLMQALAEQQLMQLHAPPPILRITGAGPNLDLLRRTGERLKMFAGSLGLINFQFHPMLLDARIDPATIILPAPQVQLLQDEVLAVNCMHYLHRLLGDPPDQARDLRLFLQRIKAMNPRVVTVAEREGRHSSPVFLERFMEALDHYGAIFNSLEATLPPHSRQRLALEKIWFGREIMDIVGSEGGRRRIRHERFDTCWDPMLRSCGFSHIPLSPFNLCQAKLLLRLHYPSEGYQLLQHLHPTQEQRLDVDHHNHCLFLGWQNQPLFSVSSWQ